LAHAAGGGLAGESPTEETGAGLGKPLAQRRDFHQRLQSGSQRTAVAGGEK